MTLPHEKHRTGMICTTNDELRFWPQAKRKLTMVAGFKRCARATCRVWRERWHKLCWARRTRDCDALKPPQPVSLHLPQAV